MGGARSRQTDYEGPVDTVYLGCWRKECFTRYGYFDEELVRNQDDELNLRMRQAGAVVWQSAKIRSWYSCRESLRKLFAQYLQYGYWKVLVLRKHGRVASWRQLAPAVALAAFLLLSTLAVTLPWAKMAWTVAVVAYASVLVMAAATAGRGHSLAIVAAMPLAFATIHAAYAFGYVRGLIDFYLIKRGHAKALAVLTR